MKTFNLKKYSEKNAINEDGKSLVTGHERAMSNCIKAKLEKGKSYQEAWSLCHEEFQKKQGTNEWLKLYAKTNKKNN